MPAHHIEQIEALLEKLRQGGWAVFFSPHSWNLQFSTIDHMLNVDRRRPGFSEFTCEGEKAETSNGGTRV